MGAECRATITADEELEAELHKVAPRNSALPPPSPRFLIVFSNTQ